MVLGTHPGPAARPFGRRAEQPVGGYHRPRTSRIAGAQDVPGDDRVSACSTASAHSYPSAHVLQGNVPVYPVSQRESSSSAFRTAERCSCVTPVFIGIRASSVSSPIATLHPVHRHSTFAAQTLYSAVRVTLSNASLVNRLVEDSS